MEYPEVKDAHIVPRSYLRNFADGKSISIRIVGKSNVKVDSSIDRAGTRKKYYRRRRPDGATIDDVEWSLSKAEAAAATILRGLETHWPLSPYQKGAVASLFAAQLVRGPRWMKWRTSATNEYLDEQREAGKLPNGFADMILSDTSRLLQMLEMARKLASAFGSTHWTLVEFNSPVIVTSDHPIVLWPLAAGARRPEPTPPSVGIMATLEIRVPVSPRLAILMTWCDLPDDAPNRVRGSRHHAAALNAFTIAEAERQWFHHPDSAAPTTDGLILPLGPQLVPSYGVHTALASRRRAKADAIMQALVGTDGLRTDEFEMVSITTNAPSSTFSHRLSGPAA